MKVIFIAGPYRSDKGEYHIQRNIWNAGEYALYVWKHGGVALCPHKNTALFGGARDMDDSVWLEGALELLSRCDAIFAITGWRDSDGAKKELQFAEENNIPVLFDLSGVRRFLAKDG